MEYETPGSRMRQLRKSRGLSQRDLAKLAALPSAGYVCRYETGAGDMQPEMLKRTAAVLGSSVQYILNGTDAPAKTDSLATAALRIHGRPKGRTTIQLYPETAETIHFLSRTYGLTTPELMEQLVDHCLRCLEV